MATYEEMIAKARELAAEGRMEEARRLGEIALRMRSQPATAEVPAQAAAPAPVAPPAAADPMIPSGDMDTRSTQEFLRDSGAEQPLVDTSRIGQPRPMRTDGGTGMDMLRSGASGLARGATELAALPGTIGDGLGSLYEMVGLIPEGSREMEPSIARGLREAASSLTSGGTEYDPQTTAGEYAQTVGEFVGGGSGARLGTIAGIGSEAAGQLTEGTAAEPFARLGGALLAPIAASTAYRGLQNVVSPMAGQIDPARQRAVDFLRSQGVNPTAGQVVGGRSAQNQLYREAATPGGRQLADDALEDFTAAALRSIGSDARRATPDVMEEATKRIGAQFDDLVRGVDVTPAPANVARFGDALDTYRELAPRETAPPIFENIQNALVRALNERTPIAPRTVTTWRSNLSKLTTSPEPATRTAAIDALEAVDDVIGTSLTTAGRPEAVQQLDMARTQWRNYLAIERAAQRADGGILTPAQLRTALLQQNRRTYVQGRGDLGPLTRAGNEVLESLPQSGTAPRLSAAQIAANSGTGTGAGLFSYAMGADPLLAGGIGLAATAAPIARNQFLSSGLGQRYFQNQLMRQAGPLASSANVARSVPGIMAQDQ